MTPWYRRKGFWNLPNLITLLRVLLVPAVVALVWERPGPAQAAGACALFVFAMLSDVVDGWLARKWDVQSVVGAFLDPIADKLMVLAALVMLIPHGWVPAWMVLVLESRELVIAGLRQIAVGEGMVIAAGALGKFKTAYQSTALGFLLWHYPVFGIDTHSVGILLLWVSIAFSVASAAQYGLGFWKHATRAS